MKTFVLAAAAVAALAPAVPAAADPPPWAPAYGRRAHDAQAYYGQGSNRGYYNQGYGDRLSYQDRVWRGRDGRTYCRRSNGTTGLIVGGAAGALIGRALDQGRSRTVGTLIGGAAGALLGREVQRGTARCR